MREVRGGPGASETEEQLRCAVDAIPSLIAYLDTDARYVWANEAHRIWFGHPPERLRGLHVREVLGAATWASVQPHVERVLAGEEVSFEHRFASANGSPRDVRAFYIPHLDAAGRVRGFVGIGNEITKTPGVDEALRRSEHMLERSQSSAHVGSWEATLVDHDGGRAGAVQWSDETYRLLGFEPGAVEISDAGFLDYVHPAERQPLCDAWTVHIQRGEPFESDFRIVRPDGTVRLLHTWTDFERDAQGRPTHMVGTCQDVTDRKRAERELLEADRRKDEFLAMLSHELRNPLAPILNAIEILHDARADDQELAARYRAIIARQVRHMKRLLDDLLDVSRVSQGKIQLQKRPIELGALLLEAVEISRPLIAEKRQQLSLALAQDLLPMDADSTRLLQVFANLLNNAAKYTDAHGHITLAVTVEDGEAVVKLRDDGTGMTPELLARVFDLFVQETRSLDRAQGGLGIGLTMVRTLVQMHGGSVRAFSDGPGRGSEFVVRLPLATPAPAGPPPREPSQPTEVGAHGVLRVLVVDDNADATQALQHLLKRLGHDVTIAHDGPAALAAAASVGPDLVLLDIGLPGMDGYAVATALREAGHDRAALVALTGYAQDDNLHRSSGAGFDRHLVKPIDFATLRALTKEIAGRFAAA